MTLREAIIILTRHQDWRIGAEIPQQHPKDVSEAIMVALEVMKKSDREAEKV